MTVLDISNPASPAYFATYNTSDNALGTTVSGEYAYISDEDDGFTIVDVGGADIANLLAGNTETGSLRVNESADIGHNLFVRGTLNTGIQGILADGPISGTNLQAVSTTTPQMSLKYDTSNYLDISVASDGGITLDATGSGAEFLFADDAIPSSDGGANLGKIDGTDVKTWDRLFLRDARWHDEFYANTWDTGSTWTSAGNGTTYTLTNVYAGGWGRYTSGATNGNQTYVSFNGKEMADIDVNSVIEMRGNWQAIADSLNSEISFGFAYTAGNDQTSNVTIFKYDPTGYGDNNWHTITADAGSSEVDDTGVSGFDTSTWKFRIEISSSEVTYYIDDVEVADCTDTGDIPTNSLQPYMWIQTNENLNKEWDWDYFRVWQDRD